MDYGWIKTILLKKLYRFLIMNQPERIDLCISEFNTLQDLEVLNSKVDIEKYSRDFFDYSPILKTKLDGCFADLVVRPYEAKAAAKVAAVCKRYDIPLTLRGSGTGNYGQCVPLLGGVVMLMGELNKVKKFDQQTGVVTVEAGCLLKDLDRQLAKYGRQLRLVPSTWRSASVGGFVAGGSGGIGSVRWGFLRDPGHLLGLEIFTIEDPPRKLKLDVRNSVPLNHAYGTNGIITSLALATAPLVDWQEVIIDCEDWPQAVQLLKNCSSSAIDLNLCCLLEKDIVKHLYALEDYQSGKHRLLILVGPDGIDTLKYLANNVDAKFTFLGPEKNKKGIGLREFSWNHTTLHMRSVDSNLTYLQMLLPITEIDAINELKSRWGNDLFWHLEAVRHQGAQRLAALPILRWRGRELLDEVINHCRTLGAVIFNPHVISVEDGGLGIIDGDQVQAKSSYDPSGLLNPGKLKGWDKQLRD